MSDTADTVKTMRLRYAGRCAGCRRPLDAGTTAHYLRPSKTVRCLACGPCDRAQPDTVRTPPEPAPTRSASTAAGAIELRQGRVARAAACDDCGRRLTAGADVVVDPAGTTAMCLECVTLDTVHVLGTPGDGARRQHAKRLDRHQTRVKTRHPRLGTVILALADDPGHITAWAKGAVGEEELGRRLSALAGPDLKVLHDRKLPRSSANIDHLVVTGSGVWTIDAKRYKGRVDTSGGGLLSRQPQQLYVGGRNQHKLVHDVQEQVQTVRRLLDGQVPVHGALVFIGAEFGLLASPVILDGVWVGWGRALRQRLARERAGPMSVGDVAKRLASRLRAG